MFDDPELSFVGHNGDVDPKISSGTTRRDRPDRARGIHLVVGVIEVVVAGVGVMGMVVAIVALAKTPKSPKSP